MPTKTKEKPVVEKKPRARKPRASFGDAKPEVDDLAKRRERKVEVNGQAARVIDAPHERVIDPSNGGPAFGEVMVRVADVHKLQELFDLGRISIPGVKVDDVCKVEISRPWKGSVVEVACPHRAVLRQLEKHDCETCGAHKTSTVVYLCLLHAIEHYGGGAAIKDMGPLFGADQPRGEIANDLARE